MRMAVLSDVHGNATALRAVLADIAAWSPDALVSAGDVCAFGPLPELSLDLLVEAGALFVRGNNDRYLATPGHEGSPGRDEQDSKERAASLQWGRERLGAERLAALGSWPAKLEIFGIEVVHASPGDDEAGIWPDSADEDLCESFSGVLACGHTHMPFVRRFSCGLVVNAGSVGWNLDGDTRASWAAFQDDPGFWQAEIMRVPYDVEAALVEVKRQGAPWSEAVAHYVRSARWRSPGGSGVYGRPASVKGAER